MNWNIEGLLGKAGECDFIQYINTFDIVCLTETFLDFSSNLDCFPEFVQFHRPGSKLSTQGRRSGGVSVLVKKRLENKVRLLDFDVDNIVLLQLDKELMMTDQHVILCATYICPADSVYYKQDSIDVTCSIDTVEQCLLSCVQKYGDSHHYLLCGDFNARTAEYNAKPPGEPREDVIDFLEFEQYEYRPSQDKTLNTFGKTLLNLCGACDLTILNGCCPSDKQGQYTYICTNGSSTIDYFLCSRSLMGVTNMDLEVEEAFESKHLPVVLHFGRGRNVLKQQDKSSKTEKIVWDNGKLDCFLETLRGDAFCDVIKNTSDKLVTSVDDAVSCLTDGLLNAANCMKKTVYKGRKQNKWFDRECKEKQKELRKAWRQFCRPVGKEEKDRRRRLFTECRQIYRRMLTLKKQEYRERKLSNLVEKANDSKLFWNEFKSITRTTTQVPQVNDRDWFVHFRSVLGGDEKTEAVPDVGYENGIEQPCVLDLDKPITQEEIRLAMGNLKCNKAAGPDLVIAEMLKHSLDILVPCLVLLFNKILDTGIYPHGWTGAIIVPIHKGGNKDNPDNYRGISLLNILGKVFTSILNKRLMIWAEENGKIAEEQGGFRAGYSTADNIYILYAIVQRYFLRSSGKVYVCFVDYKKAFDTVNRNILWNTLKKNGVGGKMLRLLRNMYQNVRSCVRCPTDNLTDFFQSSLGVRQGCVLSPTLFSFFINELALEIANNGDFGIQLSPSLVQILIMLFADDVFLASYCVKGLQKQIDVLQSFSDKFSMTINLAKTKIVVFRKGGFLSAREKWWYGGEQIETVNSYKYLGLKFTSRLSMLSLVDELATKAKIRTCQILRCLYKLGNVQADVFFKIFDAQVLPVLMYGAELWGYQRFEALERIQAFACRRLLNAGSRAPRVMVLGDLGRLPVYVQTAVRCIKYWLRIVKLDDKRLPKIAYRMHVHLDDLGQKSWAYNVKTLLCASGFGDVWQQQGAGDTNLFLSVFKQRLSDQARQDWHWEVSNGERYELYSSFKHCLQIESYLKYNMPRNLKDALVYFRLGISPIRLHTLRHRKNVLPRHLLCPVCKMAIEDEGHIFFDCNAYKDFRQDVSLLKPELNPTKSATLVMSEDSEKDVLEISKFLSKAFKKRKELCGNDCLD